MLSLMEIMNSCASSNNSFWKIIDAKTFKRIGVEMTRQYVVGVIIGEDPVVKDSQKIFIAEVLDKRFAFVALTKHFRRVEALNKFVDVIIVALSEIELAGRDIQKSDSRFFVFNMN